jgi:ADP-ribosylglycohydrolase
LFYYNLEEALLESAIQQCHITHDNQIAKDGAVCVALTVKYLLEGTLIPINTLKGAVLSEEFKHKLGEVEEVLKKGFKDPEAINIIGNSSLAPDVVGLALFFFMSEPNSFENAVLRSANATGEKGGDTDSIAFLVGAFSGAYNGVDRIPKEWVDGVESSVYLRTLAETLYSTSMQTSQLEDAK